MVCHSTRWSAKSTRFTADTRISGTLSSCLFDHDGVAIRVEMLECLVECHHGEGVATTSSCSLPRGRNQLSYPRPVQLALGQEVGELDCAEVPLPLA